MQSICRKYFFSSLFWVCFSYITFRHIACAISNSLYIFFCWKHYDIITKRNLLIARWHILWCGVLRRLFQVSQSHTRKAKSDLFPSSNAFMCRFSCLSLYFLKSIQSCTWSFMCFICSASSPLSSTQTTSVVCTKWNDKIVHLYLFLPFFFLGVQPLGWWNCFMLCFIIQ